jgi:hypothetical protein
LFPQVEPKDVLDFCQSLLEGGDKDTTNIWFHQTPPTKKVINNIW